MGLGASRGPRTDLATSSGDGTRTHDLRIMRGLVDRPKTNIDNTLGKIENSPALPLPYSGHNRKIGGDLAFLIEVWETIPEALRAGIVAMVQAA